MRLSLSPVGVPQVQGHVRPLNLSRIEDHSRGTRLASAAELHAPGMRRGAVTARTHREQRDEGGTHDSTRAVKENERLTKRCELLEFERDRARGEVSFYLKP